MPLTILNRQRKVPVDTKAVRPRLKAAIEAAGVGDSNVTLVLVSDAAIRRLNRDWRDIDRPTDVLSFSAREGEDAAFASDELGDVVISLERAKDQGPIHVPDSDATHGFNDELVFLFVHGLCHLLGHDHQDPSSRRRMTAAQKRILAKAQP